MKNRLAILARLLAAALVAASLAGCGVASPSGPAASGTAGAAALTPGRYEGVGKGHGGEVRVTVVIGDGGKIEEIGEISHTETEDYGPKEDEALPGIILGAQSLGVDAVSGATITSRAILEAVADAVTQAGGDPKALGYVPLAEISAADTITITGLADGEATVTGEQLRGEYEPVNVDVTSVNASGESTDMNATGVLLEDILAKHGASQKEYRSIVTTATDGYTIEIPEAILQTRDIIIAYEVDGQPQSPRVIIPDERAMYWAKFLMTIELMDKATVEEIPAEKLILLETAYEALAAEAEDYKYYDSVDKALPITALLGAYADEKPAFVYLASTDQWAKNEKYDIFAAQFLKFTGEDAPLFVGPDLPEGMRLKETLRMQIGGTEFISAEMAALVAKSADGVALDRFFEIASMAEAAEYSFTGADGSAVTVAAADIPGGVISLGEGGAAVSFEALDKSMSVKGLLTIETAA